MVDYYTIVKKPICLKDIRGKLERNQYATPTEMYLVRPLLRLNLAGFRFYQFVYQLAPTPTEMYLVRALLTETCADVDVPPPPVLARAADGPPTCCRCQRAAGRGCICPPACLPAS